MRTSFSNDVRGKTMYLCEFELVPEGEGNILSWPFWPGRVDGTFGTSLDEAIEMSADWLREMVLDFLIRGREVPHLPLGNRPQRGGKIIAVAIEASLDDVPAVTAKEAAGRLGVSDARVTQLCQAGALESWKVGRTRMVSKASIESRLADRPKAGRPHRHAPATA